MSNYKGTYGVLLMTSIVVKIASLQNVFSKLDIWSIDLTLLTMALLILSATPLCWGTTGSVFLWQRYASYSTPQIHQRCTLCDCLSGEPSMTCMSSSPPWHESVETFGIPNLLLSTYPPKSYVKNHRER